MKGALYLVALLSASDVAEAACGSRGGPAFRGPNGKCVGWATLETTCGSPPTTLCTYEGGGLGDTSHDKGKAFIEQNLVPGSAATAAAGGIALAPAFNKRSVKVEGVACTSQTSVARMTTCALGNGPPGCKADMDVTISKGDCRKVTVGAEATIEAGSHSFDWVRIRIQGYPGALWVARKMVLD